MTDQRKWNVAFEVQVDPLPAKLSTLRAAVEAVMRRFRERQATITITVVNDAEMKKVHKQFLHKDVTTDVVSFDLTDEFERRRVFELVVNAEMAQRQAQQRGHAAEAELTLYVIHGLLHNLGFDDDTPEHARRMHQTEDEVLNKLGFANIYYKSESEN